MIKTGIGITQLTFENGYTLSITNGFGSYSENRFNFELASPNCKAEDIAISTNCEIAIINPQEEFCTSEYLQCSDDVKAYVNIDELTDIISMVKNI